MFVRRLCINMMLKSERNQKKEMKGMLDVKASMKKTCTSALKQSKETFKQTDQCSREYLRENYDWLEYL